MRNVFGTQHLSVAGVRDIRSPLPAIAEACSHDADVNTEGVCRLPVRDDPTGKPTLAHATLGGLCYRL